MSQKSIFSFKRGFEIFDTITSSQNFSYFLFIAAVTLAFVSLSFNWGSFVPVLDDFKYADLYKISLFSQGISPYSTEAWAAPYPPFYFMVWVLPYLLLSKVLTFDQTYFAFRIISTLLAGFCAALIYQGLVARYSRSKALSISSLFLICSLTGLIGMTGDFFGLLFVALGCYFLAKEKTLLGLAFVSLAVAFKIQPIFGLIILLGALATVKRKQIFKYFGLVFGLGLLLGLVPLLLLPDAFNSFVLYSGSTIQYYSFNFYAGIADILLNLIRSSIVLISVDVLWLVASVSGIAILSRILVKRKLLNRSSLLDLLSLGTMLWLLVLKQTMPHYFLWALIPLLMNGRTKAALLVLEGEFLGMLFFGLSFADNLSVTYTYVPSLVPSFSFLIGGALFSLFLILAIRQLLNEMSVLQSEKIVVKSDIRDA
ncbi:MAG: hypothetical protein ACYCQJ_00615 [Nitrososphaerales archaeon]